jgi:hypothetical protein
MKKIFLVGGLLLMLLAGAAQARDTNGIGFYGNILGNGTGANGGLGLTLRSGSFPVIGLEWNSPSKFSGSLDVWVVNPNTDDLLSYYVGLGGYAAMTSANSTDTFNFGGRIPFGLQLFPLDPLEIFIEASPMIIFTPTIDWAVSVRLGFRILF